MASRGRRLASWLVLAFLLVPVVEIYVIIQVGHVVGAGWTVVLLVLDSLIGAWLVRREGARAWQALRTALAQGRMPATELADAGLILIGGTLMLTPGFVTDVVAVLLILPLTRPLFRRLLARAVESRLVVLGPGPGAGPWAGPRDARRPGAGPEGPIVRGEVIDD
ncbi:FxsA family protein [Nocardioides sp. TRM66260-LWL]|uniref:FxsA family protein n=1 Tax=Nocardioides sp. TRM66260-LWL TaxID=2874478 RepID=UPI001CC76AA5|nr:FxsA family protein [Nocardioides sp. TRM66260-LWL]MBZ5733992.1 FxsA family protein [Nocardioides sp. TRM66260-LWL]